MDIKWYNKRNTIASQDFACEGADDNFLYIGESYITKIFHKFDVWGGSTVPSISFLTFTAILAIVQQLNREHNVSLTHNYHVCIVYT